MTLLQWYLIGAAVFTVALIGLSWLKNRRCRHYRTEIDLLSGERFCSDCDAPLPTSTQDRRST